MSLFLLAPPSENDRSKIMEALNEPPEIGNYPSEVTLSKDATDKLIARMRSGAAKEYISKQRKEAPKTATVKRKEPERRQTLAEKKLEIFEEEYKSPSRAFTVWAYGIRTEPLLIGKDKSRWHTLASGPFAWAKASRCSSRLRLPQAWLQEYR